VTTFLILCTFIQTLLLVSELDSSMVVTKALTVWPSTASFSLITQPLSTKSEPVYCCWALTVLSEALWAWSARSSRLSWASSSEETTSTSPELISSISTCLVKNMVFM